MTALAQIEPKTDIAVMRRGGRVVITRAGEPIYDIPWVDCAALWGAMSRRLRDGYFRLPHGKAITPAEAADLIPILKAVAQNRDLVQS